MENIKNNTIINIKENNLIILADLSVNVIINDMYMKIGEISWYKYYKKSNISYSDIKEIIYYNDYNIKANFRVIPIMSKLEEFNTLSNDDKLAVLGG